MARLDVTETFHGISFPGHLHTQESLEYAVKFPFRDTDILIVSYPKSGTTWMQEIVTLIHTRGDPGLSQTVENWKRAPWLEHYYSSALLEASSATVRVITTHLPHHLLRPTLQNSKAKPDSCPQFESPEPALIPVGYQIPISFQGRNLDSIPHSLMEAIICSPQPGLLSIIYVSRNPKDVVVSFYHFHKMANFLPKPHSFPEFLTRFLESTVPFGSWFDHIKGWTSQINSNLLHVTYEEMSLDLHDTIKRISSFLQCPLVEDEVNNCVKHSSFSNMKDSKMINYTLVPNEIMDHSKGCFMRKGKVGDWKNTFTEEENKQFESVFTSKMLNCPLEFVWE